VIADDAEARLREEVAVLAVGSRLDSDQTLAAVESLAEQPLGAIVLDDRGPRAQPVVRFHEGPLEIPPRAVGWWLVPGGALEVRTARGRVLLWNRGFPRTTRAVTLRLVQLLGERRAERVLDELEAAA
jgi:hypothetical protein